MFEAVDVITLIKGGVYDDLNLSVGEALTKRADVRSHAIRLGSSINAQFVGFCRHIHVFDE